MAVDLSVTPQPNDPVAQFAPIQVEIADWFDLNANDSHESIHIKPSTFIQDRVVDVRKVAGRPETDVDVEVETTYNNKRAGEVTETNLYATTAMGVPAHSDIFVEPVEKGGVATRELKITAVNNSGTSFTQGGGDAYQMFYNYVIRKLSVVDKLRLGLPLTDIESRLARQFGLTLRENLNLPADHDPIYDPNLAGKVVTQGEANVETVDIDNTGAANSVPISDETIPRDRVLYLQKISVNGQTFSSGDDLQVLVRRGGDNFYQISTYGLNGLPYEADLHIPFFDSMDVEVFAANTINNVDVKVEYTYVERTLIEKALYNLENQVKADDNLAERRLELFQEIRNRIRAGLPIEPEVRQEAEEVSATS